MKKKKQPSIRLVLTFFGLSVCFIGSRYYPDMHITYRKAQPHKEYQKDRLPDTFGHTHFIVGMPSHLMHSAPAGASPVQEHADTSAHEVYFSPDDDVRQKLIDRIDAEQEALYLAIYSFTERDIAQAIERAVDRGVRVEIVADASFLSDRYTKIADLYQKGVQVYIYDPKKNKKASARYNNIMHNKFMIFARNSDDRQLVWTGSFNFTKSACINNQENVVLLYDPVLARRFKHKFEQLKMHALAYRQ